KGAEPRAGIVLDWLEKLGISVIYPKEGASCEGVEYIPVFNGRTGAGAYYPSEGDGECETIRAVDRAFINRLRVSPNNLYFLDVMGDSMEPLFSDGATLLVDTSDNAKHYLMDGKIYVVNLEDAVLVKRIQMSPDEIVLCSENPMHAPIRVPASEMDRFRVIGRVRWYTVNA
ncbi:MAG: S24 family peptidase, partial [Desulfovibrionaceae bacterium]|nr:S24 family peptidase [Desulfovibrionaceae bacterium]